MGTLLETKSWIILTLQGSWIVEISNPKSCRSSLQSLGLNCFQQIGIGPDESASFEVKEAKATASCDKNRKLLQLLIHGRRSMDAAMCSIWSLKVFPLLRTVFAHSLVKHWGLPRLDMGRWHVTCRVSLPKPIESFASLPTLSHSSKEISTFVQSAPLSIFFPPWSLIDVWNKSNGF